MWTESRWTVHATGVTRTPRRRTDPVESRPGDNRRLWWTGGQPKAQFEEGEGPLKIKLDYAQHCNKQNKSLDEVETKSVPYEEKRLQWLGVSGDGKQQQVRRESPQKSIICCKLAHLQSGTSSFTITVFIIPSIDGIQILMARHFEQIKLNEMAKKKKKSFTDVSDVYCPCKHYFPHTVVLF